MAGKSLSELQLKEETLPDLNYDDAPEFNSWAPPPQPGTYRLKLPGDLTHAWDVYTRESDGKQFVRLLLDKDAPLLIVQAKDPSVIGEPFQTRLANQPRPRGKDKIEVSDLDYLLKACGVKTRPAGNKAMIETVKQQIGKEFTAEISYSWNCSDDRNIRVDDGAGGVKEVENQKGCGAKYYQDDRTGKVEQKIAKGADGKYPYEIACRCGNIIRAFANLDNIRA